MINNIITLFHQFSKLFALFIQRMLTGNPVCHFMGKIKHAAGQMIPTTVLEGFFQLIFPILHIPAKVGFLDHIRHLCLDDLKSVFFQICFNVMIGTGMEIQKVLSHNQNRRLSDRSVILYLFHDLYGRFKFL